METTRARELICGDFPALEQTLVSRLETERRDDPLTPLIVLVPTNLLRRHLSDRLADRGVAHLNIHFITIDALVREIVLPQLAGHGVMPQFADELMMAEACSQQGDGFYFAALSDRPGLHQSLLGSIRDLKEAGADVETLGAALGRYDKRSPSRTKLHSLHAVWQRYEEIKRDHGYLDDVDLYGLATHWLHDHPLWHGTRWLFVYGIYDFKRVQARFILAAAARLDTAVFFPFESTGSWDYAQAGLDMFLARGFRRRDVVVDTPPRGELLQKLCDRLFQETAHAASEHAEATSAVPSSRPAAERLPVQIVSLPGEIREALELPRLVLELVRSGMKFNEIAVITRARSVMDRTVREVFDQAGLPFQSAAGVALREGRAGRSLLLMLQVLRENFARRDVMEWLTFADLNFESLAGVSDPATAVWDRLTIQAGIVRGREQWLQRLVNLSSRVEQEAIDRQKAKGQGEPADRSHSRAIVSSLHRAMLAIFEALEPIHHCRSWGELIDRTSAAFAKVMRESGEREEILQLLGALKRLDRLRPEPDTALLARLVDEALESECRADRSQPDGVTYTPIMQARGVPFRAVIVAGLVERNFPQMPSVDPILLDRERERLNELFASLAGRPGRDRTNRTQAALAPQDELPALLPIKANQSAEERLLFRLAAGAARDRLILTFSRIESESGRERVPSYFLLRSIDAVGDMQPRPVAEGPGLSPVRAEPTTSETSSRRRRHRPDQMVLPFDRSEPERAPTQAESIPQKSLTEEVGENAKPATAASMAKWPGLRHMPLAELAPTATRAGSLSEYDLGAALADVKLGRGVVLAACAANSSHLAHGINAEKTRWQQRLLTPYDGRIQDRELLEQLRRQSPLKSPISPSRIEDYGKCPFHFYMHCLLKLEPLEEPEMLARSDPSAKGKMVHEILKEFLQKMLDEKQLPLRKVHAKHLMAIAQKQLDAFEQSGAAGPPLTWRIERELLMKFFDKFIEQEIAWQKEGYRPIAFEMPFGREDVPEGLSADPARFQLGNRQTLQFRGQIDRVDLSPDGKRLYVIDYKGRSIPNPGGDGFGLGTVVQLPLYQFGAQTALGPRGDFGAAGGRYISYDPELDPVEVEPLDDESRDRLRSVLHTIATGIHNGLFMQYTGQDACRYCAYDRVCMGVQGVLSDLKKLDPAAADYFDMKGGFRLASGN